MRYRLGIGGLFVAWCAVFEVVIASNGYVPKNGFVPDEQTAIRIAEAVLTPIYGEIDEKPLQARLRDGSVWVVSGTLKRDPKHVYVGGVPIVELQKEDAKVLLVTHTK